MVGAILRSQPECVIDYASPIQTVKAHYSVADHH